ncbi:DNA circularization protein [Providencia huaxiensis]|uniref:DNA circularization protein n=1 Tax=Providencia huaxiensis TaxID=2027290 RepID=UPI001B381FD8|nr:DNA circularization N-terminal domain-containing protein [Providencia huaxiensis]MBQ0533474.1 DNA circularization protein [Providencia huaxiensis]MBQ0587031.1 DNA circularization protein [Providencia huaxiensis]
MALIKNALSSLLGEDSSWSWAEHLRQASFRGVPFGVMSGEGVFGRRVAVHEYPYRDQAWVEDLGRSTRRITIKGFLIQDSLVYDAPDVFTQRDNLIAVCEEGNTGTLIHPTLGELTVNVTESGLRVSESAENGRVFEFELVVIESGLKVFAITESENSGILTSKNWLKTATTMAAKYMAMVKGEMRAIAQTIETIKRTASFWVMMADKTLNEATNLSDSLGSVFGSEQYGRYQSGTLGGAVSGATGKKFISVSNEDESAIVDKQLTAITQDRETISQQLNSILQAKDPEQFCQYIQETILHMMSLASSVERRIQLLSQLSLFEYPEYQGGEQSQRITSLTVAYLSVVTSAAVAVLSTQTLPSSSNDAAKQQRDICHILDNALTHIGDLGIDDAYQLLHEMRTAVVTQYIHKGSEKGRLTQYSLPSTLSVLHIANRIYQDANRSDELVMEVSPRHPAFMPSKFKALKK